MSLPVLLILGGLVLLVGGAELLIRGSSRLALRLGVPSLVVGLTVVAYGTSTPELVVSAKAALSGQADLALGNVVGSNIFNVLLILGASALLAPLRVTRPIIWREVPVMIGTSLLTWGLALDGRISRGDGTLLVALLIAYTIYQIQAGLKEGGKKTAEERTKVSILGSLVSIAVGLAVLVWGARWLLEGSVSLARGLGVSELIIGLTIVAAGTSLPEVATSLLATWRGEREIAIGNVVGSNIYNVLGVLGLAAVIGPEGVAVSSPALNFDIPVMVAVSVACLPIFLTGHLIARWEGVLFLFYYGAYTLFLLLNTTHHDALPAFSATMLWGALPLTAMTLLVGIVRHRRTTRPPASS
ncbi:MAG: calcium/sodium antiporter [Elusimicrobia bacterium]|nr:calcium/sodium antiporter [Elusimicrobiota bacterium]